MTGLPRYNRDAFIAAGVTIRERSPHVIIRSPHTISLAEPTWENCMREALAMLLKCDAIYMLKGWRDSKGARIELALALELGMRVIYEC